MKKLFKMIVSDKLLLSLSVILLLIVGVSGSLIAVKATESIFRSSPEVEVIDLSGLKEDEIREWYQNIFDTTNGLSFVEVYDEKIEKGDFIKQDPKEGTVINLDTGLVITISKGQDPDKTFELPNFVEEGYNKEKIEAYFEENGFTNVTYEYKVIEGDENKKDDVLAVNKSGRVKRSEAILVTLSAGGDADLIEVKVPNMTTMSVDEIQKWASSYSINVKFEYVFSNSQAQGKVMSQSIKEGEVIKGGSEISVTVSKGKGITIADLMNKSVDQAKTYASENGFKLNTQYAYSDSIKEGLIISSSPSKGGMLAKGDTLTITVSQGIDPNSKKVTVNDYTGESESALLAHLEDLGIKANKDSAVYSDDADEGTVAYNTNGEVVVAQGVHYALSLGRYEIDEDDFNDSSLSDAQALVKKVNDMGADINLKFNETQSTTYAEDVLFGCYVSSNGKTITCKLSTGASGGNTESSGDTAWVSNVKKQYEGDPLSIESTRRIIGYMLGDFENVYITEKADPSNAGTVLSIKVNGKSFSSGNFDTGSTVIEIVISKGMD